MSRVELRREGRREGRNIHNTNNNTQTDMADALLPATDNNSAEAVAAAVGAPAAVAAAPAIVGRPLAAWIGGNRIQAVDATEVVRLLTRSKSTGPFSHVKIESTNPAKAGHMIIVRAARDVTVTNKYSAEAIEPNAPPRPINAGQGMTHTAIMNEMMSFSKLHSISGGDALAFTARLVNRDTPAGVKRPNKKKANGNGGPRPWTHKSASRYVRFTNIHDDLVVRASEAADSRELGRWHRVSDTQFKDTKNNNNTMLDVDQTVDAFFSIVSDPSHTGASPHREHIQGRPASVKPANVAPRNQRRRRQGQGPREPRPRSAVVTVTVPRLRTQGDRVDAEVHAEAAVSAAAADDGSGFDNATAVCFNTGLRVGECGGRCDERFGCRVPDEDEGM